MKRQICETNQINKSQLPLYSMTEISFHRFHVCTVGINQQTNIEMHSPSLHHTFSLLSLLLIQLFLSQTLSLSLSLSLILCCSASTKPIQRGVYDVVDGIERASTPDYSSNWDWNQLFLNISVISYNISYSKFFQYVWAGVVAEVEALYYI